jgi:hypothetical protein
MQPISLLFCGIISKNTSTQRPGQARFSLSLINRCMSNLYIRLCRCSHDINRTVPLVILTEAHFLLSPRLKPVLFCHLDRSPFSFVTSTEARRAEWRGLPSKRISPLRPLGATVSTVLWTPYGGHLSVEMTCVYVVKFYYKVWRRKASCGFAPLQSCHSPLINY